LPQARAKLDASHASHARVDPFAEATNRFGTELYLASTHADTPGKNLLVSPLSAAVALGMTLAGARGETARELQSALHWSHSADPDAELAALLQSLRERSGVTFLSANRLWGQRSVNFGLDFAARLDRSYGAPLVELDFADDPALAAASVNGWVASETGGLITDLVNPASIRRDLRVLLTNALYFKAQWKTQFPIAATVSGTFSTRHGEVPARYMKRSDGFRYAKLPGLQLVELPYRGEFTMLVALPDATDGLGALERRLTAGLERWLDALAPRTAHVALPRFSLSSTLALVEPLRLLGVRRAFEPGAEFSAMLQQPGESLAVGMIVQQTRLDVDEQGAVAAAATAVGMYGLEARDEPRVAANHPFLFLIRDTRTGLVLFIGRVEDPSGGD
jgi:serpin B